VLEVGDDREHPAVGVGVGLEPELLEDLRRLRLDCALRDDQAARTPATQAA
jgi:hypothetical protein